MNKRETRYIVTEKKLQAARRWMAKSEYEYFVRLLKLVTEKVDPVATVYLQKEVR